VGTTRHLPDFHQILISERMGVLQFISPRIETGDSHAVPSSPSHRVREPDRCSDISLSDFMYRFLFCFHIPPLSFHLPLNAVIDCNSDTHYCLECGLSGDNPKTKFKPQHNLSLCPGRCLWQGDPVRKSEDSQRLVTSSDWANSVQKNVRFAGCDSGTMLVVLSCS
jgi:hypothetical protein